MKSSFLGRKINWFAAAPVFPLIDYCIFKGTFPYATIIYFLVCLVRNGVSSKVNRTSMVHLFAFLSSLLYGIFTIGWQSECFYSILLIIFSVFLSETLSRLEDSYKYIKKFIQVYFSVNMLIFLIRLFSSGVNYYHARGGTSFFGGNTAQFIYLIFLYIAFQENKYKDVIMAYTICWINAVAFLSRGAIVMQVIITIYLVFVSVSIKMRYKMLISASMVLVYIITAKTGLFDLIITRMTLWTNAVSSGGMIMLDRTNIYIEALRYLKDNIINFILGCGLGEFRYINTISYSNPHNLLLDIWLTGGVIGLISFVMIFVKLFIRLKSRWLFIITILYGILEGIAVFFIDKSTAWIWGFGYILLMYSYYKYTPICRVNILMR